MLEKILYLWILPMLQVAKNGVQGAAAKREAELQVVLKLRKVGGGREGEEPHVIGNEP